MACKCVCTCPLEAGDRIQYKLYEGGVGKGIRLNGALELTLEYLGTRYVIYTWAARSKTSGEIVDSGESQMSREEFDQKIERWYE